MPGPEVLGVAEIAVRIGLKPSTVRVMSSRGQLPEPDILVNDGNTKLWLLKTIDDWDETRGKR